MRTTHVAGMGRVMADCPRCERSLVFLPGGVFARCPGEVYRYGKMKGQPRPARWFYVGWLVKEEQA